MKSTHLIWLTLGVAACSYFLMENRDRAAAPLLPFQGRLTDAQGNFIPDGARVVQFKIYDAPVGGQAVWNGEVQKLSVNSGLVSTLLGTRANLAGVDFDRELYLELTVDANNDDQITAADPPLLPRQSIFPVVFAKQSADSRLLQGHNWSVLFSEGANDPATARIAGNRIASKSVSAAQMVPNTITASEVADGTITSVQIAPGTITRDRLEASLTVDSIIPPGTINAFAGTTVPSGWMLCDGSALDKDRPEYARLYTAIQQSWGNGSRSSEGALFPAILAGADQTDFNLPDLRGVFLRGVNGARNDSYADPATADSSRPSLYPGGNSGNNVGSIQNSQTGEHTHGGGAAADNGTLTAQVIVGASNGNTGVRNRTIAPWTTSSPTASGSPSVTFTDNRGAVVVGETSANNPHSTEARPVNAYVNYIIKY